MYRFKASDIGLGFAVQGGFFGRDPEPVSKNPLLFLGVPAGGHCLPGRVVLPVVAYPTYTWPRGQVDTPRSLAK